MAVSKTLKSLYFKIWDAPENFAANRISDFQEMRYLKRYADKSFKLTKEQKQEIKDFWKPYKRISDKWCRYYCGKNGNFDPRYIPNTIYYTKIDQHFNNRKLGYGFNDKNYYPLIFKDILQPKTLVHKINGMLLDENYMQITVGQAMEIIGSESEIIAKPSQESGSGRGISFFDTKTGASDIIEFLNNKSESDYVIQAIIKQHNKLNEIHSGSINSIRIASILMDDGVHILSTVLRMGVNNSRVDNVTAGGISAKINPDATLDKYAYSYYEGNRFDTHPQGVVFEGFEVPGYENAIELVKKAHPLIPHFRLVSWDIAVNEEGQAVLIEANMRKGGINLHQFDNGPLFGELTEKVLEEVFRKKL